MMMMRFLITIVIYSLTCIFVGALKAGDFFNLCHKNDPDLGKCIASSLDAIRDSLKKGIPELQIPPLDPMFVPKIGVTQGSGPVSIDSSFENLKIYGMTNYNIVKIEPDFKNYKINFEATLPYFYNEGNYNIEGKILVLPISGKGPSWSNYTDVSITASLKGSPKTKSGKLYMEVDDFQFDLDVKKAKIHMENLFNGNKQLGDAMNDFMSENWEVVYKELKPVVNQAVTSILKDVAVKVFRRFPLDELLLP